MLEVHGQIVRAAPSNATVLIRGESGVGKGIAVAPFISRVPVARGHSCASTAPR
ncbi:MAG: sigma 54-interacting transcriptional regulator [Pirellulaceae bacterium]